MSENDKKETEEKTIEGSDDVKIEVETTVEATVVETVVEATVETVVEATVVETVVEATVVETVVEVSDVPVEVLNAPEEIPVVEVIKTDEAEVQNGKIPNIVELVAEPVSQESTVEENVEAYVAPKHDVVDADPVELVLHPLSCSWDFYYSPKYKKNSEGKWTSELTHVATIKYVEELGAVWNAMCNFNQIPQGWDINIFKSGIPPAWEHEKNVNGGRWDIKCKKSELEDMFKTCVVFCVSGNVPCENTITGLVLSSRGKNTRLSIWNTDYLDREATMTIGEHFKAVTNCELTYTNHKVHRIDKPSNHLRPDITI